MWLDSPPSTGLAKTRVWPPSVEAAQHDPVATVVEQGDREALVGAGVLERVEAHQPDVLQAAARADLQVFVQLGQLLELGADLDHLADVRVEQLLQRSAPAVPEERAVCIGGAAQAPGLLEGHDRQADDDDPQDPNDERQVVHEGAVQVGHGRWYHTRPDSAHPLVQHGGSMARRGGKAANRRDRQRRAKLRAQTRPQAPARPITGAVSDAVDAVAESRSEASAMRAAPAPAPRSGPRADPRFSVTGPSRLSERASSEYHYVLSDLRNIAVLIGVMAVLLAAAVVAFSVLKIGPN